MYSVFKLQFSEVDFAARAHPDSFLDKPRRQVVTLSHGYHAVVSTLAARCVAQLDTSVEL